VFWVGSPPFLPGEEIDEGHRLVTVGAGTTGADATAEDATLRTALVTQIASVTGGAFVDGRGAGCAFRDGRAERSMTAAPEGLPASRRTDLLAPPRGE
jgi:hypothetical protein